MESKAGSILALISGILTILIAVIVLIVALVSTAYMVSIPEGQTTNPSVLPFFIIFIAFIILLVIGIFKIWAAKLMKVAKTTEKGGIIALILGIITGDILSLVGGILGIVQGPQK